VSSEWKVRARAEVTGHAGAGTVAAGGGVRPGARARRAWPQVTCMYVFIQALPRRRWREPCATGVSSPRGALEAEGRRQFRENGAARRGCNLCRAMAAARLAAPGGPPPAEHAQGEGAEAQRAEASARRRVHFAESNLVFCVEKFGFSDLRGDTRDLHGRGDDPDWWSIGSARSRKLAEFAESFTLRKTFGFWHSAVFESAAAHRHSELENGGAEHAAAERRVHEGVAGVAVTSSVDPHIRSSNLSMVAAATLSQPYYLSGSLGSSPPLPNSLSFQAFEFAATRVCSDDEEWSEEWSDWDSETSSVRQSLDLVAADRPS